MVKKYFIISIWPIVIEIWLPKIWLVDKRFIWTKFAVPVMWSMDTRKGENNQRLFSPNVVQREVCHLYDRRSTCFDFHVNSPFLFLARKILVLSLDRKENSSIRLGTLSSSTLTPNGIFKNESFIYLNGENNEFSFSLGEVFLHVLVIVR